ncbi:sacsin N-terminal ATP-binding-like domain-containing protein [Desulfosediminicola ganghwensis]|uniref:sacsin N-terminal ATP-binding-like domain-containing protein n=1 Tax=Desulfosediminicola ganghwensis TaxID=2569540 RepID=UPI0010AC1C03|nr:hypothetical protein [Desulfosediminicola ganghwensis]
MLHTLETLVQKRQRWIDVNRENNFEEGIKRLLTELYPDNAHFIYELLQNAEDQCAKVVRFTLSEEDLEFEHNGERLFELDDVESITSIGATTKRGDPTSIGKFGVGFKAVFAYTSTPEIHSGAFHFRIQDLVVPITNGVKHLDMEGQETRFIFPFDHPTKSPRQAIDEIIRGLKALSDNSLLFLNHIRRIEYMLPDGSLGFLERIDHKNGQLEIHAFHPGSEKSVSRWLRYQKKVEVIDEDGEAKQCRIAIAYNLHQEDKKTKSLPRWKVMPLDHGQVSIYFPAEKETSNMRFHIHAPFASTVARDSIRDCDANRQLRDCIVDLVVESLTDIRDRGMLTMGFLTVLPNELDNLSPFYEPIRDAIVCAFKDEPLTPTRSGSHAPATALYRGPVKISEVLSDNDLSLLTNYEPPLWAANPPLQNQRDDRFLDSLKIYKWGWSNLFGALSSLDEDKRESIESWIAQKDDAWVMRFYALLGEACHIIFRYLDLKDFHFVRIETGQGVEHVLPREAFFPLEQETPPTKEIRFVKHTVYRAGGSEAQKKYARAFLEHIGVRTFDAKTVVELKLSSYRKPPSQVGDDHYRDLKQFIAYWKKNPSDAKLFIRYKFLLGKSPDGALYWFMPSQLCIDSPYQDTGLSELTHIHKKHVLWTGYKGNLNKSQFTDFIDFVRAVGAMHRLQVSEAHPSLNPRAQDLYEGLYGAKITHTRIDSDYSIDSLSSYTKFLSISASRLVWQALIGADKITAKAKYRPNQKYDTREVDSQLVQHLKTCAWVPDKSGAFNKPKNMTKENLRKDFPFDDRNGLLTAIGFGERSKKLNEKYVSRNHEAQKMGFETVSEAEKMAQLAKLVRKSGQSVDMLIEQFIPTPRKSQPLFPSRSVPNQERRRERLDNELSDAPNKEYKKRERSVRTTKGTIDPTTWLRNQYTNEADQMVCQICKKEMPFRKRDRTHYFEKKEVLTRKYLPTEHEAQYLALCPLCAAKYDEFVRTADDVMADLQEAIVSAENSEVPISLGDEKTSIRFVESHYHDLRVIIEGVERQQDDDDQPTEPHIYTDSVA